MNNNLTLICPFNEKLLNEVKNFPVVIRTDNTNDITTISKWKTKNRIVCILADLHNESITSVEYREEWKAHPMIFYVSKLGSFKDLMFKLPMIRHNRIKFFLPADKKNSYESLQIISSLGLDCGITFNNTDIDFQKVTNLMTYAVYGKAKHSKIDPFNNIVENYKPQNLFDINIVYFDSPVHYLHLDDEFNIYLTKNDFLNKNPQGKGLEFIESIKENKIYRDYITEWHNHFLGLDECAACPGWRICKGFFADVKEKDKNCKVFINELLEASEFYLESHKEKPQNADNNIQRD